LTQVVPVVLNLCIVGQSAKSKAKRQPETGVPSMPAKKKLDRPKRPTGETAPACGLCGNTKNLTKTECCGRWICDDEHKYVLFSYSRNSCYRNHRRMTLCGHHAAEGHDGDWRDCPKCREEFETEMYVWYGTNEYNFEKLKDPPRYEPTKCHKCGRVIVLSEGGYSMSGAGYFCERCTARDMGGKLPR